jgi:hypothetical protein
MIGMRSEDSLSELSEPVVSVADWPAFRCQRGRERLLGLMLQHPCWSTGIDLFTSLPCAQDTGGENPCIDTKDV